MYKQWLVFVRDKPHHCSYIKPLYRIKLRKMRIVKICIFLLMLQNAAKADCIACWETQFIQIEYNNGSIEKGFMLWNKNWILDSYGNYDGLTSFCDTIAEFYNYNDLRIYKKIKTFNHFLDNVPISVGDISLVLWENVHNLTKIDNKFNHLQGAITIPEITEQEETLMLTKPIFIYKTFGEGLSDAYYLNYNPRYSEEYLKKMIENRSNENLFKVIKIEVHYD